MGIHSETSWQELADERARASGIAFAQNMLPAFAGEAGLASMRTTVDGLRKAIDSQTERLFTTTGDPECRSRIDAFRNICAGRADALTKCIIPAAVEHPFDEQAQQLAVRSIGEFFGYRQFAEQQLIVL